MQHAGSIISTQFPMSPVIGSNNNSHTREIKINQSSKRDGLDLIFLTWNLKATVTKAQKGMTIPTASTLLGDIFMATTMVGCSNDWLVQTGLGIDDYRRRRLGLSTFSGAVRYIHQVRWTMRMKLGKSRQAHIASRNQYVQPVPHRQILLTMCPQSGW